MTASTTIHPYAPGRKTLAGIAAAIAVAGGAALAFTGGDDAPRGATAARLTPEAQRYVDWIVSATPEELAATFGRGPVAPEGAPVKSGDAVR